MLLLSEKYININHCYIIYLFIIFVGPKNEFLAHHNLTKKGLR